MIGALFGSFFNVCIYRIPTAQDLSLPGSYCYACGTPIHWYDNIPIFTYFILGGRCRACKAPFSIRYALIELLNACLFLAVFWQYQYSWATLTYLVLTGLLLIASFTDVDLWIIPDRITKGGAVAGIVLALVLTFLPAIDRTSTGPWILAHCGPFTGAIWWVPVANSIVGALSGAGLLWLFGFLGSMIFRQPAMGLGDVKLLAMIGAFTGWLVPILSIFLAAMTGMFYGLGRMLFDQITRSKAPRVPDPLSAEEVNALLSDDSEKTAPGETLSDSEKVLLTRLLTTPVSVSRRHHIIFGPHLALAAWILMMFERPVVQWLRHYFSIQ